MTALDLSARLFGLVESSLVDLISAIAPGLALPRTLGGHIVRSDAQVDLLYVLAQLIDSGRTRIGDIDLHDRAHSLLSELEPDEVEGFFSYRVAESVSLLGGLQALTPAGQRIARRAAASPRLMHDVVQSPGARSPNFLVVAARCLNALRQLGEPVEPSLRRDIMARTKALFASSTSGWINDGRAGFLQFDIYTPEMYVLAEPFADALSPHWLPGFSRVLADVGRLGHPAGAITWGRSVGPLSSAMTLELVPLAFELEIRDPWWDRAGEHALEALTTWFDSGLVVAHRTAGGDSYRGPARRLQQSFDLLGKVVWSARRLQRALPAPDVIGPPRDTDALIDLGLGASIWAHRTKSLDFVLPLMLGRSADYLPSPRCPNLFEQPVDGFPVMLPTLTAMVGTPPQQVAFVPAGVPTYIAHEPGRLVVRHRGWWPVGTVDGGPLLEGSRTAIYTTHGRTLEVNEVLMFNDPPERAAVTVAVPEVAGQPLHLEVDGGPDTTTVETGGIPEWRSHWNGLDRVHSVDIAIADTSDTRFTWTVTRAPRLATTEPEHQYSQSLYAELGGAAVVPAGPPDDGLGRRLAQCDMIHIAWPERWVGTDPEDSRRVIAQLRAAEVRILWTQHNLVPHAIRSKEAHQVYALWAEAADGVIHHTDYGMRSALTSLPYQRASHHVIRHGHWGDYFPAANPKRAVVEAEEGWPATAIRLGIIGQPRPEKDLQAVVDAVAATDRHDIQLVARLGPDVRVPNDPRIIANYGHVQRSRYYRRLTAMDVIILPFRGSPMVATGTAFDCIGGGIAAISSPWEFLQETFDGAELPYDGTRSGLTQRIESLSTAMLAASSQAMRARQSQHDWATIGVQTMAAIEDVLLRGNPGQ